MAPRDENDLTLEIEATGEVTVDSPAVLRRLAEAPGRFRILPSVGDLLILQRVMPAREEPGLHTGVALTGELDGAGSLGSILNLIQLSQWDGVLAVVAYPVRKAIYFKRGHVLSATSNLPADRIGSLLLRYGYIKEDDLAAAIREIMPQRKLGTILLEKGLMAPATLYAAVRRQAEEIFYSILHLTHGAFYFSRQLDEPALPTRLHLDTQVLLLEGMRRLDEMARFKKKLPSEKVVLVRRQPPGADLGDHGVLLYRLADDRRNLGELIKLSRLGEFAGTQAAFQLVEAGCLEVRADLDGTPVPVAATGSRPHAEAAGALIDAYSHALGRLVATMSKKGKAAGLRQAVRSFLSTSVRFSELFRDVVLDDDGSLPRHQILANIDGIPDSEVRDLVRRGLNELLFFVLFVAGEDIDQATEQEVHAQIARAVGMTDRLADL